MGNEINKTEVESSELAQENQIMRAALEEAWHLFDDIFEDDSDRVEDWQEKWHYLMSWYDDILR